MLASTRKAMDSLSKRLQRCDKRPTDADRRRAVRKLVAATAGRSARGFAPGEPLGDDEARTRAVPKRRGVFKMRSGVVPEHPVEAFAKSRGADPATSWMFRETVAAAGSPDPRRLVFRGRRGLW